MGKFRFFVTVIDSLSFLFTSSLIGFCAVEILIQTEQIFVLCNIDHNDDADGGNDDPDFLLISKLDGMIRSFLLLCLRL